MKACPRIVALLPVAGLLVGMGLWTGSRLLLQVVTGLWPESAGWSRGFDPLVEIHFRDLQEVPMMSESIGPDNPDFLVRIDGAIPEPGRFDSVSPGRLERCASGPLEWGLGEMILPRTS
jgi:hypothetical protein